MSAPTDDEELSRARADVAALLETGNAAAAVARLAAAIGGKLDHALVPEFLGLSVRAQQAQGVEGLVAAGREAWPSLPPARALEVVNVLAQLGRFELAFELAGQGALATDREGACLRGGLALHLGRVDEALAAADVAVGTLLHEGVSVADFLRLTLQRAPAESLLRYERDAVAHVPELHEPLALRWEALRRAGKKAEAAEMRDVCLQHFPERASVWATAGNQALDEGDPDQAERYFERALRLDPNWPTALAGSAIVLETRKDWNGALRLRQRVVEVTGSLQRDDPASLHRMLRFAAALARVDRWGDAEPIFRHCLALGAFDKLPPERPVFSRVFLRELYSPAIIASLSVRGLPIDKTMEDDVRLALREANALGVVFTKLRADESLAGPEKLGLLGMCAWLAGDVARAYALFDEAEQEDAPDLALHYLLASSAVAVGAADRESIVAFAVAAAGPVLARAASGEPTAEPDLLYAKLIAARSGTPSALEALVVPPADAPEGEALPAKLRRLVAHRAAARATGRSALEVARSSLSAVDALLPNASPSGPGARSPEPGAGSTT